LKATSEEVIFETKFFSFLCKPTQSKLAYSMRYTHHAFICTNLSSCAQHDPEKIQKYLKSRLKELGLHREIRANKSGCLDGCSYSPVTVVYPEGIWYRLLTEEDAERVLQEHLIGGKPVEALMVRELNLDYPFQTHSEQVENSSQ
jgi:(2Fe-2S) ferredoxin